MTPTPTHGLLEAPPAVLFVDDEPHIRRSLSRCLRNEPLRLVTAASAPEALERLAAEPFEVLVSDHHMPGCPGVELLAEARERYPEVVRILLTGGNDVDVAVGAINRAEVYRLLTKPWQAEELRATLRAAASLFRLRRDTARLEAITAKQNQELQALNRTLEARVRERTLELRAKHDEVREGYLQTIQALAEAVDAKDPYTRGHSERVGVYASRIAHEMGLAPALIERIYLAGLLHDIGKIGIPDAILEKPERLTTDEYDVMKRHPEIGARILEPVRFLADIVPCVRHHHEWYDGSERGYPDQLRGTRIPLPSRVILVADTVDAMTSDRPYRRAMPLDAVIEEISGYRGTQLDPVAVDACLSLLEREETGFLEQTSKFELHGFLRSVGESA